MVRSIAILAFGALLLAPALVHANPSIHIVEMKKDAGAPDPLHTIIAGVALSLAFICGGLWLVRRRCQRRTDGHDRDSAPCIGTGGTPANMSE